MCKDGSKEVVIASSNNVGVIPALKAAHTGEGLHKMRAYLRIVPRRPTKSGQGMPSITTSGVQSESSGAIFKGEPPLGAVDIEGKIRFTGSTWAIVETFHCCF